MSSHPELRLGEYDSTSHDNTSHDDDKFSKYGKSNFMIRDSNGWMQSWTWREGHIPCWPSGLYFFCYSYS